jgi:hypothetical protein
VGKKLAHGAEFNFQRGFFLPMECLTQIKILKHCDGISDILKSSRADKYASSHFFDNKKFNSITIQVADIITAIKHNIIEDLNQFKETCPQLFSSARFIRSLLKECDADTLSHKLLLTWFNESHQNIIDHSHKLSL